MINKQFSRCLTIALLTSALTTSITSMAAEKFTPNTKEQGKAADALALNFGVAQEEKGYRDMVKAEESIVKNEIAATQTRGISTLERFSTSQVRVVEKHFGQELAAIREQIQGPLNNGVKGSLISEARAAADTAAAANVVKGEQESAADVEVVSSPLPSTPTSIPEVNPTSGAQSSASPEISPTIQAVLVARSAEDLPSTPSPTPSSNGGKPTSGAQSSASPEASPSVQPTFGADGDTKPTFTPDQPGFTKLTDYLEGNAEFDYSIFAAVSKKTYSNLNARVQDLSVKANSTPSDTLDLSAHERAVDGLVSQADSDVDSAVSTAVEDAAAQLLQKNVSDAFIRVQKAFEEAVRKAEQEESDKLDELVRQKEKMEQAAGEAAKNFEAFREKVKAAKAKIRSERKKGKEYSSAEQGKKSSEKVKTVYTEEKSKLDAEEKALLELIQRSSKATPVSVLRAASSKFATFSMPQGSRLSAVGARATERFTPSKTTSGLFGLANKGVNS
jgi:hypothetical protein